MEGTRTTAWKNKRRKSLYDRESKEAGLLYRELSAHAGGTTQTEVVKRLTRSQSKRLKREPDINFPQASIQEESTDKSLPDNTREYQTEQVVTIHQDEGNNTVTSSIKVLPALQASSSTSSKAECTTENLSKKDNIDKDKILVEKFCSQYIRGLKKDVITNVQDEEIDEKKLDELLSALKESLLSSDMFRKALDEPIVIVPYYSESLDQMKEAQEAKLQQACNELEEWSKIANVLSEEKTNDSNGEERLLGEDEMRSYINEEQLQILDIVSRGLPIPDTHKIEETITQNDQLLKQLMHQIEQEATTINNRLDKRIELVTSLQEPSETPRTLIKQLKKIS